MLRQRFLLPCQVRQQVQAICISSNVSRLESVKIGDIQTDSGFGEVEDTVKTLIHCVIRPPIWATTLFLRNDLQTLKRGVLVGWQESSPLTCPRKGVNLPERISVVITAQWHSGATS